MESHNILFVDIGWMQADLQSNPEGKVCVIFDLRGALVLLPMTNLHALQARQIIHYDFLGADLSIPLQSYVSVSGSLPLMQV